MTKPKKKSARSLDGYELPPWKAIVFTDIHFHAKTIDRGLRVLEAVRKLAVREGAMVIFLGDWWELRGALPLRQLDPILTEFGEWEKLGIQTVIIPGNHDQVSADGLIHGTRVFDAFRNITVATERVLWPEHKMAFLPWRQDPEEQAELFDLPGDGWAVFAHAEVEGASTNYGHTAIGRVTLAKIASHARACYCGHYHKRQQLGDRTWYIGSPFQKNFGEMDHPPKGVALIEQGKVEPTWIHLEGFPKHYRVTYGVPYDVSAIQPDDIVEFYAPPDLIGTEDLGNALRAIPAHDVRPLPLKEVASDETGEPTFALSLDEALDAFVGEMASEAAEKGADLVDPSLTLADVAGFARAVLAELPEARAIQALSPRVEIDYVEATDFCALAGTVRLNLRDQGLVLLKGPIGSGKTALTDAIAWCLYGQTSPRKAGSNSATFRGDEVVNDYASSCAVKVGLVLEDGREVTVDRSKTRQKGAVVKIEGIEAPDGISDSQDLIVRTVGLDYALFRTCVSLGQGTVASFVTEADKARKDLLSNAFGLNACPAAQKLVRDRLKPCNAKIDRLAYDVMTEERVLETLTGTDFAEQISEWEARKVAAKQAAEAVGAAAKAAIATCDKNLASEDAWRAAKVEHSDHLEALLRKLGEGTFSARMSEFSRDFGAAKAERSVLEAQLTKATIERDRLQKGFASSGGGMPCPVCKAPMASNEAEALVTAKGVEVERIQRGIGTHTQRMANLEAQMHGIRSTEGASRDAIEAEVKKARDILATVDKAIMQFDTLRRQRDGHEYQLSQSRVTWEQTDKSVNPWIPKQAEVEEKVAHVQRTILDLREQAQALQAQKSILDFWEVGFGPKGIPVLVLRTALHELELYANRFLAEILGGRIYCKLGIEGDSLTIRLFEQKAGETRERRYEQLSGGQRRCVELAFSPFALSEMVFARCGVRVPLLVIDELTTHLGADEKPIVCDILRKLDRSTVLVIDHDGDVQAEFDEVYTIANHDTHVVLQGTSAA